MTVDEVRAQLQRCSRLPEGRAKTQSLESVAEQAKAAGDRALEAEALIHLSYAYGYSSERDRIPVSVGALLQLLDTFPAEVGGYTHQIFWLLKWMTSGLYRNPAVPLATVDKWLDEFDRRYRQHGYSLRPVLAFRSNLAGHLGDREAQSAHMEASIAAPRDDMSDCQACEPSNWGSWRVDLDDDEGALRHWAPVIAGEQTCTEEPHWVLARALLPLVRLGRTDEARSAFLRGYPLARHDISLMDAVGQHIEFCALTGNEPRGLEIFTEHATWLGETQVDRDTRLSFVTAVAVLTGRLTALGHAGLSLGAGTVADLGQALRAEITELCAAYDTRNGNRAVSDRVATRLARPPLLDALPLGLPARLPAPGSAPAVAVPVSPSAASPASAGPAGSELDALIARARELADVRHPEAGRAWAAVEERAGQDGTDLPADVAVKVARARAGRQLETDPGAAREALLSFAGAHGGDGNPDTALEARAVAAIALGRTGGHDAARREAEALTAAAREAFDAGTLTPRNHVNIHLAAGQIEMDALAASLPEQETDSPPALDPDALAAARRRGEAVLALAAELDQGFHQGQASLMLAQLDSWQRDPDGMRERFAAAREAFLAAGTPWCAAQAEDYLARFAMGDGDPARAEELMRAALDHGGALLPAGAAAPMWTILADALAAQEGRDAEFAAASLEAAARWDGISEPDTVHATFNAARAYRQLGRHAEAAELFGQAIAKVDVPYDPRGAAMTRDAYGRSLREIGQYGESAEQFLQAARDLEGDADNQGPLAVLAAMAAEDLERSGQPDLAVPAYRRAADLFGALGDPGARIRALRAAAWQEFGAAYQSRSEAGDAADETAELGGIPAMRAALAENEAAAAGGENQAEAAGELAGELENTREQLGRMLAYAAGEDGDEEE